MNYQWVRDDKKESDFEIYIRDNDLDEDAAFYEKEYEKIKAKFEKDNNDDDEIYLCF